MHEDKMLTKLATDQCILTLNLSNHHLSEACKVQILLNKENAHTISQNKDYVYGESRKDYDKRVSER